MDIVDIDMGSDCNGRLFERGAWCGHRAPADGRYDGGPKVCDETGIRVFLVVSLTKMLTKKVRSLKNKKVRNDKANT